MGKCKPEKYCDQIRRLRWNVVCPCRYYDYAEGHLYLESHCASNGLGVLCLGMRYRWFTTLSHAPNTVSNEHYPFGPYFLGHNYLLDTGGRRILPPGTSGQGALAAVPSGATTAALPAGTAGRTVCQLGSGAASGRTAPPPPPLRSGSTALTSPPTSDNPLTAQNYKLSSM